jgi:hypothetical protein
VIGGERQVAYDDEFGSCLETRCELAIYPGHLLPEEVSTRLGLEPTSVQRAGETSTNSRGRVRTTKVNGWFLSSENVVASKDLRRHLDWLIAKVQPAAVPLAELRATPGVEMWIGCVWWSKEGHGGPTLSPEQMRAIAALDLECSFDVYFEAGFTHLDAPPER